MSGSSSWSQALVQISPYTFSAVGIAISIGVSVLGAAWGIYITGSSLIGAAIKAPRITSKNLIRKTMPVEEILTIDIKPGWKKGTKITFPEKGNEQPNVIPADIVFIIDERPHFVFTREGNDLVVTKKIALVEALTGYTVHLTTLDGRSLTIPINSVIHPGYEEIVPGEGMPIPKDPSRKGKLRIKFDIKFPTRLLSRKLGLKDCSVLEPETAGEKEVNIFS